MSDKIITCPLCGCKIGYDISSYKSTKHETPEQYKERTGKDYPDDWAIYYKWIEGKDWKVTTLKSFCSVDRNNPELFFVTALNGKPDPDWRLK